MKKLKKSIFKVEKVKGSNSRSAKSKKPLNLFKTIKTPQIKSSNELEKKNFSQYICLLCKENCKSKLNYNNHLRSHNKPKFQCNICLIVSLNKTKLAQHMRANHMFKCSDCPKVFLCEEEYLNHSSTHLIKKNILQFVYLTCLFYLMRNTCKNSDPISLSDNQRSSFETVKSATIPRINRRRVLNKAEEVKEFCKYDLSTYDDD